MDILKNDSENILIMIKKNINLFESFESVYLFGSVLNPNIIHNDIDLLVIYKRYTREINCNIIKIQDELQKVSGKSIDLTALSVVEQKETAFLKKLEPCYIKIK